MVMRCPPCRVKLATPAVKVIVCFEDTRAACHFAGIRLVHRYAVRTRECNAETEAEAGVGAVSRSGFLPIARLPTFTGVGKGGRTRSWSSSDRVPLYWRLVGFGAVAVHSVVAFP